MSARAKWLLAGLVVGLMLYGYFNVAGGPDPEDLRRQALDLQGRVVKLRGLKLLRPVRPEVATKESVIAKTLERFAETGLERQFEKEADLLFAMGLMERDYDAAAGVKALLLDEYALAGFYHPVHQTLDGKRPVCE